VRWVAGTRSKGVALSVVSNWFNNFIIGLITPPLVSNTREGAFIFFAVFSALSWVFTFFVVPETKGRTLEEMDIVFNDHSGEAEIARKEAIIKMLEHDDLEEVRSNGLEKGDA
jgi:hypothetical protein